MSQKVDRLPPSLQLMTCSFWGMLPFVSVRLLWAWSLKQPIVLNLIVHMAVDDLESFIWVLSWSLVHILKKNGSEDVSTIKMEKAFGNLMRDWLRILMLPRHDVEQLRLAFPTTLAGWDTIACNDLAPLCNRVYEEVLESGFSHREEISRYSQWEGVVKAMEPSMWRPSR